MSRCVNFSIGDQVIYRPRHQSGFVFATVTALPGKWVTIEFDVDDVRLLRSVKPDRIQYRKENS